MQIAKGKMGAWRLAGLVVGTGAIVGMAVGSSRAGGGGEAAAGGKRERTGPFARYDVEWRGERWSLSEGEYLVALLSDSCAHCAENVAALNRLAASPDWPPVVGLILGEAETLEQFRAAYKPEFPTRIIPVLEFFELIGEAPPRFHLVRDGAPVKNWDGEVPGNDERGTMSAEWGMDSIQWSVVSGQ